MMKINLDQFKVGHRIIGLIVLSLIVSAVLVIVGVTGLAKSNATISTIYVDRLVPLGDLSQARILMLKNQLNIFDALSEVPIDATAKKSGNILNRKIANDAADDIEANMKTFTALWDAYMLTYLTPEEKILANKFVETRNQFAKAILKPSVVALRNGDYNALKRISDQAPVLNKQAGLDMEALLALQVRVAKEEFAANTSRYNTIRLVSYSALALAAIILTLIGLQIMRSITLPLKNIIQLFGFIATGKLDNKIEAKGDNELSDVLIALQKTQEKLEANLAEQAAMAKQSEEQAIMFEAQLDAINTSTGMLEMDIEGNITKVNNLFLTSFGYTEQELIGKNHTIFLSGDNIDIKQNYEIWAKLKRGESSAIQIKRNTKNGKEIWLDVTYNPILSAAGDVTKVVNYYRDITEQKLKDLDIYGQLNAISRSQGVVELDTAGNVIKVNKVYLDMLGYQEQDLLNKHVSILLDPTFANSTAYKELWSKLVSGGTDAGQYKRIGKGGNEVWIQASYNPIKDLSGKVIKIVNYTIDITAEKLLASDNANRLAAISNTQGVIEFDINGKILAVNDNFAAVTGYSKQEIVGNHHSMFVDAAYKASAEYKAFWEKLGRGESEFKQYRRIGKGGKEVWLQASYNSLFDLNGKPYKVVKYAVEITEQKNASLLLELAVAETQGVIEGAKTGDLSSRVSLDGKTGAIAALCDGVNALMDKMTEVIAQVREAGETINTAAGEIASGNNDLSSRTEQQASSLEETASSMEELASTVKQNAENAKQANQLAAAASGVAVKGGEVVGQVVQTMGAINTSAKKIEDIISVIDGIAFQTNILALNAAVEAARAGEQGRGFAVVAGEVRNLAQRSASAAKEIKELITDSVSKTAEGTAQVENAGKTMQEIVSSVQRVTDIMGEISAASLEQSTGIDQVNNAITSMDEVTQQNAALVEEAAAAAESLVEQASSLMDTVGAFKLQGMQANTERRASSSAMRNSAPVARPATKSEAKPASQQTSKPAAKVVAKTGTNDSEWEEF